MQIIKKLISENPELESFEQRFLTYFQDIFEEAFPATFLHTQEPGFIIKMHTIYKNLEINVQNRDYFELNKNVNSFIDELEEQYINNNLQLITLKKLADALNSFIFGLNESKTGTLKLTMTRVLGYIRGIELEQQRQERKE